MTAQPDLRARHERRIARLPELLRERILVLDGAMGTLIQRHELDEADFRGDRFRDHPQDLRGANDLLALTQPDVIREHPRGVPGRRRRHHRDEHLQRQRGLAVRLRARGRGRGDQPRRRRRLAREAADEAEAARPGRPRYVAGSLGPTTKTASLSPDVNDPGARNVTFDQLADAYHEAARGLVAGGADLLLIETIFDTLNGKAAIFARRAALRRARLPPAADDQRHDHRRRPDATCRGQTVGAFWNCRAPRAAAVAIGLNCALGRAACCGPTSRSWRASPTCRSAATRTPACRTPSAATTSRRRDTSRMLGELARAGAVNIVGGCCGTTPEHIARDRRAPSRASGRASSRRSSRARACPAWSRSTSARTSLFVNVGERTNVTGSRRFARLITEDRYAEAVEVARQQVDNGAQMLDINMDEGMLDSRSGHGALPEPARRPSRTSPRSRS